MHAHTHPFNSRANPLAVATINTVVIFLFMRIFYCIFELKEELRRWVLLRKQNPFKLLPR